MARVTSLAVSFATRSSNSVGEASADRALVIACARDPRSDWSSAHRVAAMDRTGILSSSGIAAGVLHRIPGLQLDRRICLF